MTTVISTTETAGCDVTMRRILGRWSEATNWVRSAIWARTRSVVQPMVCLSGREPASISTITWANCLGSAVAWPAAGDSAVGPGAPAGAGAGRLTCGLVAAASRATGHAAPWVSQSYGGQPAGTATSRSPEDAAGPGGVGWPGAASGAGRDGLARSGQWPGRDGLARSGQWPGRGGLARSGQWPGRGGLAGNGRRVRREGARRHVSSSRSGECERPRTPWAAAFVSGSGWTRLYLRPPTFRRPAWLRSFHGVDERRSPSRRISV